ncbi:MAG TPA: hypothetical protein VJ781_08920 [Pyrinomonadaceae bacterium]|nr:hypothetical protein [Pyrinomonadaceae bacterium]
MRAFAIPVVLISATLLFAAGPTGREFPPQFQAFCNDGEGPLSEWMATRYEAYVIGREHEQNNRGHRWEILVQQGEGIVRVPVCARLTDGKTPDTAKLENTCGKCVRFLVSRTGSDQAVKAKEIKIDAKKARHFRKLPNTTIRVEGERDCPE